MKKIVIKKNKVDKILQIPRPTILPIDWDIEKKSPQEYFNQWDVEYFYNKDNEVVAQTHFQKWDITENAVLCNKELFELTENPTTNYFYIIGPAFLSDFYNINDSFDKLLGEEVLNDVLIGKCKIVILQADDGYFGESVPFFCNDDTFQRIDKWSRKSNLKKESVIFISQNMITKEVTEKENYNFLGESFRLASETHISNLDEVLESHNDTDESIEKLFLTYNKHTKHYRIYLMYNLVKNNLIDNSIYSFHKPESDEYINHFECVNKLLVNKSRNEILLEEVDELYKTHSKKIEANNWESLNFDYHGQIVEIEDYKKTFLSLVSESNVGSNTIYFSEKTFKPIVTKHPFILLSSPGSLKKLKDLGYKTFDKWWDESYDDAEDYIDRVDMVLKILKELNKKSLSELEVIKKEMKNILDYNLKHYFDIKENTDFLYNILKKH